jgi:hypothetical protein
VHWMPSVWVRFKAMKQGTTMRTTQLHTIATRVRYSSSAKAKNASDY